MSIATGAGLVRSPALIGNQTDGLAHFFHSAALAAALGIALGLPALDVEAQPRRRQPMREERGDLADGARLPLAIVEREITFGGCVVLENARNAKAALKDRPHLGPQAIAAGDAQGVLGFVLLMRRIHGIAAQLADVLKQRAALVPDIAPKIRGGENDLYRVG